MVSDNHCTDAEINDLLNEGITEHWDLLVTSAPPDYYSNTTSFATTSGTSEYALATYAADFYKLRAVQVLEGTDEYRPIGAVQDADIQRFRPPNGTKTVRVRYIPAATTLANDNSTFDGVNGWEELAVLFAAIDILNKRGQDPSALMAKRDRLVARIQMVEGRDGGEPPRIKRAAHRNDDRFRIYQNTVDGYILRGANLELYRYAGLWAV